jgi:acyl CoA:acetate/3-ketoacid CoA transferase beta subunit
VQGQAGAADCIGDWKRPRAQLLGVRGAPGNAVNHPVSYWIPRHSPRVFVEHVDMVCGVGYDRGDPGPRELRVVVTNLAVLDFATPGRIMRLRSVHPGVGVDEVAAATGFPLAIGDRVPVTRRPTVEELGPTVSTQPSTTSSTASGSAWVRASRAAMNASGIWGSQGLSL